MRCAAESMIRTLAWCGTNQATSSARDPRPFERGGGGIDDRVDRAAEHLFALHLHEVAAVGEGRFRCREPTPARGDLEDAGRRTVAPEIPRQKRRRIAGGARDHRRARAVAEQDDGAAVVGIGDARQRFRADEEDVAIADADHRSADDEFVHESRAGCREIEGTTAQSERVADERACVRQWLFGRRGRDDEQVDVVWSESRRASSPLAAGGRRERRGRFARPRDPPFAYSGALDDPLVTRIDAGFEVGVGDAALGYRETPSDYCDWQPSHATRNQATG